MFCKTRLADIHCKVVRKWRKSLLLCGIAQAHLSVLSRFSGHRSVSTWYVPEAVALHRASRDPLRPESERAGESLEASSAVVGRSAACREYAIWRWQIRKRQAKPLVRLQSLARSC